MDVACCLVLVHGLFVFSAWPQSSVVLHAVCCATVQPSASGSPPDAMAQPPTGLIDSATNVPSACLHFRFHRSTSAAEVRLSISSRTRSSYEGCGRSGVRGGQIVPQISIKGGSHGCSGYSGAMRSSIVSTCHVMCAAVAARAAEKNGPSQQLRCAAPPVLSPSAASPNRIN